MSLGCLEETLDTRVISI